MLTPAKNVSPSSVTFPFIKSSSKIAAEHAVLESPLENPLALVNPKKFIIINIIYQQR